MTACWATSSTERLGSMTSKYDLQREATDLVNSTVWYDPRIDAEWRDVSQTYFPDWQAEVGCPFVIFLAGRLIDNGEPYEGLVEPDLPLILLDAGMVARGRVECRSTLVHEGAHVVVGHRPLDFDGNHEKAVHVIDHGPDWGHRMEQAAQLAFERGEHELASAIMRDVEQERCVWNVNGPRIVRALGGALPSSVGWFDGESAD